MFDIGWSELVVIGVVALIAIGPKELPGVLRSIGQMMAKVRRMAGEFQGQFQEAMREAEMADLKKGIDDIKTTASNFTNFDPLAEQPKSDAAKAEPSSFENPTSSSVMTSAPAPGEPTADTLPKVEVPLPETPPQPTSADIVPPIPAPSPMDDAAGVAPKKAGSGA